MRSPSRRVRGLVVLFAGLVLAPSLAAQGHSKVGRLLERRLPRVLERTRVIVRTVNSASANAARPIVQQAGGTPRRELPLIHGFVADIPNAALDGLEQNPNIERMSLDRSIVGAMERTGATIGATTVRQNLGYDGSGIGVAVIDSGVTAWHDDLSAAGGGQRVDRFVYFVNDRETAYDDYGHGTHVAGIIAGNGYDSGGARSGVAPGAHLVVLKVLDASGG